jgi:predicted transcriptional regulator
VNVFSARIARSDLIRNRLRDTADKLCEGSMTPLLTQLVQANSLTDEEIAELRAMIDQIGKEGSPA